MLYTDGLIEAFNEKRSIYGLERLCACIEKNWELPAEQIKQKIIQDVEKHISKSKQADDITLLVIKKIE